MRIGHKMNEAIRYIAEHPGCSKLPVARAVGPNGSTNFGYRIVNRCLAAGLIEDSGRHRTRYELTVTEAGMRVIS